MLEPHFAIEAEAQYRIDSRRARQPRTRVPGPRRRQALARTVRRLADAIDD
ncbi:hypothetical protein [Nocardioides guangzhouensis]|uniref:hypothetical protein n=1 Tax=Nocardioides guangzhouensis TaxID=2497878 RepID=UPI001438650B|nr:hypothetical protein [Nocardioides guangzhouensis]